MILPWQYNKDLCQLSYTYTGNTPCKYGPIFALYLYHIESNRVNTVQNGSVFTWRFSCDSQMRKARSTSWVRLLYNILTLFHSCNNDACTVNNQGKHAKSHLVHKLYVNTIAIYLLTYCRGNFSRSDYFKIFTKIIQIWVVDQAHIIPELTILITINCTGYSPNEQQNSK